MKILVSRTRKIGTWFVEKEVQINKATSTIQAGEKQLKYRKATRNEYLVAISLYIILFVVLLVIYILSVSSFFDIVGLFLGIAAIFYHMEQKPIAVPIVGALLIIPCFISMFIPKLMFFINIGTSYVGGVGLGFFLYLMLLLKNCFITEQDDIFIPANKRLKIFDNFLK